MEVGVPTETHSVILQRKDIHFYYRADEMCEYTFILK